MLGKAFGIPENSVRTYAEAEIRARYNGLGNFILFFFMIVCRPRVDAEFSWETLV